ncbi:hypothetical protein U9M48_006609 [Paspalum notatum var. saurae]|uniref:Uncharacterized protein n=1 Tax=Paspalum notatum var. saurae TaxID=547442 RepID=A0AAQ3PPT8_PASNO
MHPPGRVEYLEVRDSMQMQVAIAYSWDMVLSRLLITAPRCSPNTDGIHHPCVQQQGSDHKRLHHQHSLGANNSWAHVTDVLVEKATLVGTTNGVRIKTWQRYRASKASTLRSVSWRARMSDEQG